MLEYLDSDSLSTGRKLIAGINDMEGRIRYAG